MTGAAKRKGDEAEREAAGILADQLGYPIRRKLGAGRADDIGDLDGIPATVVQVANRPSETLRAVIEKPLAAEVQRERAGATFAATMLRIRGGAGVSCLRSSSSPRCSVRPLPHRWRAYRRMAVTQTWTRTELLRARADDTGPATNGHRERAGS